MATLPERISAALELFGTDPQRALDELDAMYAPHMTFIDPIQTITSRADFRLMNERLGARAAYLRFEDVQIFGEEPHFMARWRMVFRPKIGPEMTCYGASEFRSEDGLIAYHRDYWDTLGTLMTGFPMVEPIYKKLTGMLG